MTLFGMFVIGLACFWLLLIGIAWSSFGGFFAAIFALAYDHLRSSDQAAKSQK